MSPHILIVGAGSVGRRHARNLSRIGCDISCVDPRLDRQKELASETPIQFSFSDLTTCVQQYYDGIVIASPTKFHPDGVLAATEIGAPILLEKPPAMTLLETRSMFEEVERKRIPLLLGYTWRWWPPLIHAKNMCDSGVIGRILHGQFSMAAHLADWHPWERYQDFFMSSKALGGGALLDESHWLDLMIWIFGMPNDVMASIDKKSNLEIDADDSVDAFFRYKNGLGVTIHLDLFSRPHQRSIRFTGERGTIYWSGEENSISYSLKEQHAFQTKQFHFDRNEMFNNVAAEFVDIIREGVGPSCGANDGVNVMRVIEAIRQSNLERKAVNIGDVI